MFFPGTLQEGITTALQQSKSVACFVADEQPESQLWETEFLKDESIINTLRDEAVVLRLKSGSEEAGYLAAIFPIPNTPTLVIIKNGDLKEYIAAGVSKTDFLTRVTAAFRGLREASGSSTAAAQAAPTPAQAAPASDDLYDEGYVYNNPSRAQQTSQPSVPSNSSQTPATAQNNNLQPPANMESRPNTPVTDTESSRDPATPTPQEQQATRIRNMLQERSARLEAERKVAKERANELRAKAIAKADKFLEEGDVKAKQAAETRKRAADALKKKQSDAREEKERILKRIEDDRAERKNRDAERAALRDAEPKFGDVASSLVNAASSSMAPAGGKTALQVRLLDGGLMRSQFDGKDTIRSHVRKWIDEKRTDGKEPYILKAMITNTSKKIDDTEEDKSLQELGLAPSATLVLSPVTKYTSAYEDGPSRGIFGAILGFFLAIYTWITGLITGVFSGIGNRVRPEEPPAEPETVREHRQVRFTRFATLNDQRRDQQLYNGNSLNFEPRHDDEETEE